MISLRWLYVSDVPFAEYGNDRRWLAFAHLAYKPSNDEGHYQVLRPPLIFSIEHPPFPAFSSEFPVYFTSAPQT